MAAAARARFTPLLWLALDRSARERVNGRERSQPPDAVAAEAAEPVQRRVDPSERLHIVALTARASDRRLLFDEHPICPQQLRCPLRFRPKNGGTDPLFVERVTRCDTPYAFSNPRRGPSFRVRRPM